MYSNSMHKSVAIQYNHHGVVCQLLRQYRAFFHWHVNGLLSLHNICTQLATDARAINGLTGRSTEFTRCVWGAYPQTSFRGRFAASISAFGSKDSGYANVTQPHLVTLTELHDLFQAGPYYVDAAHLVQSFLL